MRGSYLYNLKLAKGLQQSAELASAKLYLSKKSISLTKATEKTECSSCKDPIDPGLDVSLCAKCGSVHHVVCANESRKCGGCGAVFEVASDSEREAELEIIRNEWKKKQPSDVKVTITKATEKAKCSHCNGKIKKGFDIAICKVCQSVEHKMCAEIAMKCDKCGASFEP